MYGILHYYMFKDRRDASNKECKLNLRKIKNAVYEPMCLVCMCNRLNETECLYAKYCSNNLREGWGLK